MELSKLQDQIKVWSKKNFPKSDARDRVLGVVEEVGELQETMLRLMRLSTVSARLSHLALKEHQGIRYTREQLEEMKFDAVGDIMIYLLDFCATEGINAEEALKKTATKVLKRDWTENPMTAGDESMHGEKIPTHEKETFYNVTYNPEVVSFKYTTIQFALEHPPSKGLHLIKITEQNNVSSDEILYIADGDNWVPVIRSEKNV